MHIDILPGGSVVGMDVIADDVAIWCTLRNEYILNYVWIDNYVHAFSICYTVVVNVLAHKYISIS